MQQLTEACLEVIKKRPTHSHKGTFGKTLLIGGNARYGGAIMMSAEACVNAGAGLTTVACDLNNQTALHARLPEVMVVDWTDTKSLQTVFTEADVILVGPGMGTETTAAHLLEWVLSHQNDKQWLVIDGSAITLIANHRYQLPYPEHTVFTPHQMEWQRLSGLAIKDQRETFNQKVQEVMKATIVLKSSQTEIYANEGSFRNIAGNPGMATGGMGDTLAGIITAFLAQFEKNTATINAAVYLHSFIGNELAQENYIVRPTAISESLSYWMKKFEK